MNDLLAVIIYSADIPDTGYTKDKDGGIVNKLYGIDITNTGPSGIGSGAMDTGLISQLIWKEHQKSKS